MGNEEAKPIAITKRKNYSFDAGQFKNFSMDKIMPTMVKQSNHISSSVDIKQSTDLSSVMPSIMTKQSSVLIGNSLHKMSLKQQNAKLEKLTRTNDELRKQLIEINKKLSDQLQKKKMPTLIGNNKAQKSTEKGKSTQKGNLQSSNQIQKQKDKHKTIALKKQLQNAYNQVSMYKKQIESLKKNDSHQGDMQLQTFQDKVTAIDQQISNVQKSIEGVKDVVVKQNTAIKGFQEQLAGEDVESCKREIIGMKDKLKRVKEVSRKKEKDEKMRHELLIQMERKLREINEEYVPEIKNWGLEQPTEKSRISTRPNQQKTPKNPSKSSTKTQQKQLLQIPSKIQFQKLETNLKSLKQTHQEYNRRIDTQLKKRTIYKQERLKIEEKLQSINKTIENLYYKKDRYMQLIMGNISLGTEGMNDILSAGDEETVVKDNEIVAKGENLEGQVEFNDRKVIKNFDKIVDRLKIVTVNVWTDEKGHIISIQFYYTDDESFFVGTKSAQFNTITQKSTLELTQDDFIRNAMGTFNNKTNFLQLIIFESFKGKILKVGKESLKNDNWNLRIGKGQRPVMISGACVNDGYGWRINRLDFLVKG